MVKETGGKEARLEAHILHLQRVNNGAGSLNCLFTTMLLLVCTPQGCCNSGMQHDGTTTCSIGCF